MRNIVSNTGPILHLFQADSLDLLEWSGRIAIPPSVANELGRHIPAWDSQPPDWIKVVELVDATLQDAQTWRLSGILDVGEADALALSCQLRAVGF